MWEFLVLLVRLPLFLAGVVLLTIVVAPLVMLLLVLMSVVMLLLTPLVVLQALFSNDKQVLTDHSTAVREILGGGIGELSDQYKHLLRWVLLKD